MNMKSCGTALASAILAVMWNQGIAMGNCASNTDGSTIALGTANFGVAALEVHDTLMPVTAGSAGSYSPIDPARGFLKQSKASLALDLASSEMDPLDPLSFLSNTVTERPVTALDSVGPTNPVSVYLDPEIPPPSLYSGVVVTAREPRLLLLLAVGMAAIVAGRKRLRSI